MRRKTVLTATTVLALSSFTYAQEPVCTPGLGYMGFGAGDSQRSPHTTRIKSSFEQRLLDGSYVRGYTHLVQAQDAKGRMLSQFPQGCHFDKDGKAVAEFSVSVFDPETKTTETWQVGGNFEKLAHIRHQPAMPTPPPTPKLLSPEVLAARRKASGERQLSNSEFKKEDLGTRSIAGVIAKGTRSTRTIPPGEEGNELPLMIVTEFWRSSELGLTLMHISDDPRRGRYTWEVEEISRTEPDPALFTPPADYKIVDDPPPSPPVVLKP